MWGTTAREQRKTPLRLTEMTESNASSVIVPTIVPATAPSFHLTSWASRVMPALLTSTSTAPHFPTTSATADSTSARSQTLTLRKSASPPSADSSRNNASCPASLTSHAATRHPSLENRRAVARPIPAAAPVTMTTLPRRPGSFIRHLKRVLQRKLDYSGTRGGGRDLPKVSRSSYVDGIGEIHVVKQIEKLGPELQSLTFRDWNGLHDGEVRVDLFWSPENISSQLPEVTERRGCHKSCRVEIGIIFIPQAVCHVAALDRGVQRSAGLQVAGGCRKQRIFAVDGEWKA